MEMTLPSATFWHNKRVLLTGHTGFKGSWLTLLLNKLGAQVTGLSLISSTQPALFELANLSNYCDSHIQDIRDAQATSMLIQACKPDIVIHMAAQALVLESYRDPLATYSTNIMGTANLLEALCHQSSVRAALMITTDKVYENKERQRAYKESDKLGGYDPYSASKAASEIIIKSYRDAFLSSRNVAIASVRAGNVIGGGDWSQDRLLPDAVRAWQRKELLTIRKPDSIRPWQHVLDPLMGYLILLEKLWDQPELAQCYNFGPATSDSKSVRQVIKIAQQVFSEGKVEYIVDNKEPHETGILTLDTSLARERLGVSSQWPLETAVKRTMQWYQKYNQGASALELCLADIDQYEVRQ